MHRLEKYLKFCGLSHNKWQYPTTRKVWHGNISWVTRYTRVYSI